MSKSKKTQILTLALILLLLAVSIHAEVPTYITYQGRLLDSNGDPMADVEHDIVLKIYEDDATPTYLWSSGTLTGTPTDGLFSIHLGPIPSSVFTAGSQRYLGVTIDSDPEMTPRTEITSVPYAYRAQAADTADFANNIQGVSTQPGTMLINNDIGDSAIILSSELASNLSRIYMIDPGDDGKLLELVGNHLTNEAGIHLIDPGDDGHTISLTSSLNSGSFKMFNPQPEPPAVLFEVNASTETGATLNIYDEIGQVMGFEPMPFKEGYGMKIIDPGDDGKLLEIVGNHVTNEAGIYLIDPGDDGHTISMTSSTNAGSIKMFNPQPEPPALLFDVTADATNGPSMGFYNSFGAIMRAEQNMTGGFSIKMEDPDEEPVQSHVELGSSFSIPARKNMASDGGYLSLYSPTDYLQTHLTPGNLTMYHESDGIPGPPIYVNANSSYARIGIGTDTPSEALVIGKDLGSYSGELVVVGNDSVGRYSGIKLGEDADNNGTMLWSNANDYILFTSKILGTSYTPLVLDGDKVGINTSTPTSALHVSGNIYATGSITEFSDGDAKTNVETIDGALDIVDHLRGVRYNLKPEIAEEFNATEVTQVGLIAQEVEEVLPEIVNSPDEGYKSINYSRLTAVLVEAVKELKTENEKLRARIDKLENQ